MIITAIERQKRRQRVNVYGEGGRFAFALALHLAQEAGLYTGMELSQEQVDALQGADARHSAYDAALRLLSYRPRSEKEMRRRLARRGVDLRLISETVQRLKERGYLDDEAFARFWTETRETTSPRGRRLIAQELRAQGVGAETAAAATASVSDEEAAYRAASRRLHAFRGLDFDTFRRRLGGFLVRRGFSYEVARRTMDRCWQEVGGDATQHPAVMPHK
jgi:regulatory protein